MKQKQKLDQEEANKQIVEPLQKASEEVKVLTRTRHVHNRIMNSLGGTQAAIMEHDGELKDIEWQFEVRL